MSRSFLMLFLVAPLAVAQEHKLSPMEVHLADGSRITLSLMDDALPLQTPHGRLVIPLRDIRRIEFGPRLPESVRKRIDAAIAALGGTDVAQRDTASAELLKIGKHTYPAVVAACRSTNRDQAISARHLRQRFLEAFPDERLPAHDLDVIHTDDSRIAGRIEATEVRARDEKFGEKTLRVADLVKLSALNSDDAEDQLAALPDPGTLTSYARQTGKSFLFSVTGTVDGSIYGTDIYTTDSRLATACVHCGVLKPGQSGVVRVTIQAGLPSYVSSTRNGVTSHSWGQYSDSYKISRVR